MNVLFMTTGSLASVRSHSIYPDLIREFLKHGHQVHTVSSYEKRSGKETECLEEDGARVLKVRIGNLTKCGLLEKGISTLTIAGKYRAAMAKYFPKVEFDLILYSTPPITLVDLIASLKARDQAMTYLMLKDIFPQNAVDLGMLTKTGPKSILYSYFRGKEKQLYRVSDRIGCMSQANVRYLLEHNPGLDPAAVDVCPNAMEIRDVSLSEPQKAEVRERYGIPADKTVFVYGGNLGKPQDIPFVIECLKRTADHPEAYFVIAGDGTEYGRLRSWVAEAGPGNVRLIQRLPAEEFDRLTAACDVGLIFLDHRFTIPNFPSRLLSYMQAGLSVLACTDPVSDVGDVIEEGGFGWRCGSDDPEAAAAMVDRICRADRGGMGERALRYLRERYDVSVCYAQIMEQIRQVGDKRVSI